MIRLQHPLPQGRRALLLAGVLVGLLLLLATDGRAEKPTVLHIGTSGSLTGGGRAKEESALKTLKAFIKDETGLTNEVEQEKDWRELAGKMSKGKLHIGIFQGDEFAWAEQKYPELRPLVLAINIDRYPVGYVVTRRDSGVKDISDLKGKTLGMASAAPHFLRTFLGHLCGKKPETFFSKVKTQDNVEDALDDTVDGVVQAVAVDRASLLAYKRRKPGRFRQLRELARSEPFPPVVIAYFDHTLDRSLLHRFRTGLVNANRKEKGRTLLTLFRLTGFQEAPDDFTKVVHRTQKDYPPPKGDPTK
jgi:ABC-type phosphate/phosphonate transport system substrate-binding protein